VKRALKAFIRSAASRAPWGARYAMLDGCLDRMRIPEMYGYLLPRLKISEVSATGDRGVISSPAGDNMLIAEYAQTGTFAPTVTEALQSFFAPAGGTYLDIGANIGLMTVPFARDPRVHCIAFEPEPVNFDFLRRNVVRNAPDSSAELHQVALFHSRSMLSLAIAEGNIGDHRVTISGVPGRRTVEVSAVPLDDFLDRITMPLAVKIDTQGAEPFIIEGGQQVLTKAGLLVMEFCPYLMRQLNGDPEVPIALLSSFSSLAVMRGGKAETPRFMPPGDAVALLRDKLRTALETDEDYLDIIARR
jgi:FkbM family methyltransferase